MRHIKLSKRGMFNSTVLVIILLISSCTRVPEQAADIIYTGGDIVTINDAQPTAEAVAVANGKILAVGAKADVLKHKRNATKLIDLNEKTLMPGFFDAHSHLFLTTLSSIGADLYPPPMGKVDSMAKLKKALIQFKAQKELSPGQWIIGMNYDDTLLKEKRHPIRDDLDQVSTEHPIIIIHISAHLASANSKALELAGISSETKDPVGGRFVRRPGSREPNGVMESNMAFLQVIAKAPTPTLEQVAGMFADTLINSYAANGITTAQEAGGLLPPVLKAFQLAADKNILPIDLIGYPKDSDMGLLTNHKEDQYYRNRFRIGGLKLIYDGSIQGYTAYLSKPYHVPPKSDGQTEDHCSLAGVEGLMLDIDEKHYADSDWHDDLDEERGSTFRGASYYGSQEDADLLIESALKNGWHIQAHTNGDAATDMFIQSMRKGLAKNPVKDHRATIIHAQMMREDQLDAARELGLAPSFFPAHIYYWGDRHRDIFIGPERAARLNPLKGALDRGVRFTLHHDAPVTTTNMMIVIQSAVNRVTSSGKPLGREFEIPVMEALKAVTINAAWQEGEEDIKGSIEAGKLADLVILSSNPLKVKSTVIKDIKVIETIKEGKSIYVAP
ncbi:MAG: amidohydrolase [bacterium]|nr:amidohydrolase [bacterium]